MPVNGPRRLPLSRGRSTSLEPPALRLRPLSERCERLLMDVCKAQRLWQSALALLPAEPSAELLSSAVKACSHRWRVALALLRPEVVEPVITACTSALRSALRASAGERARKWEAALQLFYGQPKLTTLSSAVSACAQTSQWRRHVPRGC